MSAIARPYAIAVFELAAQQNLLRAWETMLDAAAIVTHDPETQRLLNMPQVSSQQLASFYEAVLASLLNAEMKNFIQLLAEYHRLAVLPDIADLFKIYRAAEEKKLVVQVKSAVELNSYYQKMLMDKLTQRLKRQITLQCETDANLLGGAIITAGDTVIDGSVRGKLERMVKFISESL